MGRNIQLFGFASTDGETNPTYDREGTSVTLKLDDGSTSEDHRNRTIDLFLTCKTFHYKKISCHQSGMKYTNEQSINE